MYFSQDGDLCKINTFGTYDIFLPFVCSQEYAHKFFNLDAQTIFEKIKKTITK
jgi:hypothetical protein